jgi:hypothetical protein
MSPKRWLSFLLLGLFLSVSGVDARVPSRVPSTAQRQECVVYVTRTGTRYHVSGCRYLRQSRIPVSKKDAEARGYTPCRVCGGSRCS